MLENIGAIGIIVFLAPIVILTAMLGTWFVVAGWWTCVKFIAKLVALAYYEAVARFAR